VITGAIMWPSRAARELAAAHFRRLCAAATRVAIAMNATCCNLCGDDLWKAKMTLRSVKLDFHEVASGGPVGSATSEAAAEPRIGPNSLIQTLRALKELEGDEAAPLVMRRAGLAETWPAGMIPEEWFVRLVRALRETLPSARAEAVLRRSGTYTADYVGKNRIPAPVRVLLALLPRRLSVPVLLAAFRRHAWTFAGAGQFSVEGAFPGTILLAGCPTCRTGVETVVGGRAGAYYEAAFEGLLSLAAHHVHVREVACQASHEPVCRFQIFFDDQPPKETTCASS
jgi:divinyl protochlorophyllide a 8-vinyl-reductase